MPQLDASSFSPQLVWLAISFIVLYVLMAKVALPKVGQVLDERQFRIDDNLDSAAKLKTEAEAAAKAYDKSLADARAQAQAEVRKIADAMAAEAARHHAELGAKLGQEIAAAEAKIAQARDAALENLREMAVGVARQAAGKLTGIEIGEAAAGVAVDAVLKGNR